MSKMPIAASIPLITDDGIYAANLPAFNRPNTTCNRPANDTEVRNALKLPNCAIAPITMTIKPAAGPLTLMAEPLNVATITPPMMPEIMPLIGATPDALAIPRHKGRATRKTTMPASRSVRRKDSSEVVFIGLCPCRRGCFRRVKNLQQAVLQAENPAMQGDVMTGAAHDGELCEPVDLIKNIQLSQSICAFGLVGKEVEFGLMTFGQFSHLSEVSIHGRDFRMGSAH